MSYKVGENNIGAPKMQNNLWSLSNWSFSQYYNRNIVLSQLLPKKLLLLMLLLHFLWQWFLCSLLPPIIVIDFFCSWRRYSKLKENLSHDWGRATTIAIALVARTITIKRKVQFCYRNITKRNNLIAPNYFAFWVHHIMFAVFKRSSIVTFK